MYPPLEQEATEDYGLPVRFVNCKICQCAAQERNGGVGGLPVGFYR